MRPRAPGKPSRRVGRRCAVLVLGLAGLLCAVGCGGDAAAPKSILLVTLDTVRPDRLSVYGHPRPTSPNLAWLARRGVRFDAALAPSSSTAPTHASIFTGRYASFHSIGAYNSQFSLDDAESTLAEQLAAAGFATAAFVSNPLLQRPLGLDQGFGHYDDETRGEGALAAKGRRAARTVERALAWLDARPPGPFFLWLHLQDAHGPYAPDPQWACPVAPRDATATASEVVLEAGRDQSGYRAIPRYQVYGEERRKADYLHRYDCEIAYVDAQLGRLFARWAGDPALRDALLVVTADHGEALGEDDFYFAHGHAVGLDQVRVPLIVAGGGIEARGGREVDRVVSLTALFATILEAAGVPGADSDAASLWPLLTEGSDAPAEGTVYVESLNQVGAASQGWLVRRDLHGADERAFWSGGNPNAGGAFWKALGATQSVRIAPPAGAGAGAGAGQGEGSAPPPHLLARLDGFADRVQAARTRRRETSQRLELGADQLRALQRLGYAE